MSGLIWVNDLLTIKKEGLKEALFLFSPLIHCTKSSNYSTIQTFSIVFPSLVLVKCKIDKMLLEQLPAGYNELLRIRVVFTNDVKSFFLYDKSTIKNVENGKEEF
ncbi:hypothetical protein KEH51_10285 [[Brevibacterium] frigoritolerans]|uniref:Uncharacterized protein n=1 Tax=Peribacillus frigoritolerans TaxID=450367 RepID=A0A941FH44_9BACI|nr:hypothetical protein [Peribacillus frigoritolerans]